MNTNFFNCTYTRIRNKVADSLSLCKKYYVVYFAFVILGVIIGYLFAKDIPKLYNVEITNFISLILYEKSGIFSVFRNDIILFLVIYVLCLFGAIYRPIALALYPICSFISFRTIRYAVCLIIIGGLENILCALVFYVVYYLLYLFLLSYTVVVCTYLTKVCSCKIGLLQSIRIISSSYLICIFVVLLYSVAFSLILSIFAI